MEMLNKYFSLCKKSRKRYTLSEKYSRRRLVMKPINMFELVLDQSLMNFIKNKKIPFESLKRKQSKGWKDLSKTEIMKQLDKLAKRFDTMGSLKNKSESIGAAGFMVESSFEDADSKLNILEGDDKTSSSEDEQDCLNSNEQSFKTNTKRHEKQERKSGKREKRRFHNQNVHKNLQRKITAN
ncbi:unnamed protein product [Mytilus coruscus]|uniref:Uncharacterized protein n=1 Tax=Mytilus coruscus TaxID=42192 RepID=A0A6J8CA38_MYTCO|nr:unnamed protein product [Mytilus coruscus]